MTEKEKEKAYDKKIREAILNGLIDCRDAPDLGWSNFGGIHIDDCIAWLEKQRDKDKLIQELGEYKVKYTQEVLEKHITSMNNKDDERLRKNTISFLKEFADLGYENAVECIDWLEKQGEDKKEINNFDVLPGLYKCIHRMFDGTPDGRLLFEIGNVYKCLSKHDRAEFEVSYGHSVYLEDPVVCKYFIPFENKDEQASSQTNERAWSIQDAKDGDVLALSWLEDKNLWEKIIIFKKYHSGGVKGICSTACVEGYGNTFKNGKMAFTDEEVPYYSKTWTCNLHPATKEQRDFLFQKIKEAGYKWNTETKTLEKLVEPKFKVGDKIVNLPMKYMGGSWTQGTISKITDDKYIFTDSSYISISSQDSWELVDDKKPKFDPKTLKPFDRVLVRDSKDLEWNINMFSYIDYPYRCLSSFYRYCIPYNNDTKHLIGTTDEAPEYYRYWED